MRNGWAMQRRARTANSIRMSISQVKKYLNFAESKTKIHNGNGLSATSIKGHTKEMHKNAPIQQEKYFKLNTFRQLVANVVHLSK